MSKPSEFHNARINEWNIHREDGRGFVGALCFQFFVAGQIAPLGRALPIRFRYGARARVS
jgi:hypothetical protein